jgi:hypothetical protein
VKKFNAENHSGSNHKRNPDLNRLFFAGLKHDQGRNQPPKNDCCAIGICGYVGGMNWQQFLPLAIVLFAVVLFVWRSSGKKSAGCDGKCSCSHDRNSAAEKKNAVR